MTPERSERPERPEQPERMDRLDFVSSIVLTLFGIGALVESLRLPRLEHLNVNPYTVPGIVPVMLGIALTLCGLVLLVRSTARGGWRVGITGGSAAAFVRSKGARRTLVTLVLTLVYALVLFPLVPFWIGTTAFVFLFIVVSEAMTARARPTVRGVGIAAAIAIVAGVGVGYVFQSLFYVRLPG